jgi:hypothetical protein
VFYSLFTRAALEIEIKRAGESISQEKIREAINRMNYVEIEVDGRKVYIKSKLTPEGRKILKAVGMKAPSNIVSEEEQA